MDILGLSYLGLGCGYFRIEVFRNEIVDFSGLLYLEFG